MTRAEALRQIAAIHEAWSLRYGDGVPSTPDGDPMWNADQNASPEIDDPLNEQIKAILAQIED